MMPTWLFVALSLIGVSAWIVQECGFYVKPLFGFYVVPAGFCKSGHIAISLYAYAW